MPLFKSKKPSKEEVSKELERKLIWANDDPEPTFDISNCAIKEIPAGLYSKCKVLRKEVLLMHNNAITRLESGGELKSLHLLRVLDVHSNQLSVLPEEIRFLTNLQVLNLSDNHIKIIPRYIAGLQMLQTLDLHGNKLKELPEQLGKMKSLRTLNVSHNDVTKLPIALANARTLENLIVDVQTMIFPTKEVATAGTTDMMKVLCTAAGIDYIPPSQCLLPVLDNYAGNTPLDHDVAVNKIVANAVEELEKGKERKRQELLSVQQQVLQSQEEQAYLATVVKQRHDDLLKKIAEDDTLTNEKILFEQKKKEKEIVCNLTALGKEEQLANDRIASTLQLIERSKRTEELLDEIEKERLENENLMKISQEEAENLRKKEVLENMNALLRSEQTQELRRREYEETRKTTTSKALQSILDEGRKVDELLNEKDKDQSKLVKNIANEEIAQMEAFRVLQMQTDSKHQQITNQIELLEKELQSLSFLEMERKKQKQEDGMRSLEADRQALIDLFVQLIEERERREDELTKRMIELEERREGEVEDYWLIQFQRLMDNKPGSLVMKERVCDETIYKILASVNAEDNASKFVKNEVTWEILREMNDDNLKEIGVNEYGVRWRILKAVETKVKDDEKVYRKESELNSDNNHHSSSVNQPEPSAPPLLDSIDFDKESSCVICMEAKRDVIFLLCGHVCSCSQCSIGLKDCPMCRQPIMKTVKMFMT